MRVNTKTYLLFALVWMLFMCNAMPLVAQKTKGWNTYSDVNFSMQYPEGWVMTSEVVPSEDYMLIVSSPDQKALGVLNISNYSGVGITLDFAEAMLIEMQKKNGKGEAKILKKKMMEVSGIQVPMITWEGYIEDTFSKSIFVVATTPTKLYVIMYPTMDGVFKKHKKDLFAMLKSLTIKGL